MKKKINIEETLLLDFLKSTKYHLNKVDEIMKLSESFVRGKAIAEELNRFNFDFDRFLCFVCKVPLDDLQKVLNKTFKL